MREELNLEARWTILLPVRNSECELTIGMRGRTVSETTDVSETKDVPRIPIVSLLNVSPHFFIKPHRVVLLDTPNSYTKQIFLSQSIRLSDQAI